MNKAAFLFVLISFAGSAQPGGNHIPADVAGRFERHFRGHGAETWSVDADGNYCVEFRFQDHQTRVCFDGSAKITEVSQQISRSELPTPLTQLIDSRLPGCEIVGCSRSAIPGHEITYSLRLKEGTHTLLFHAQGDAFVLLDE
jgi:hypothetical protein